jgi:protein-tyrosine phosphatase
MLRILFVCTGNRCRSPFAAASLSSLTRGADVETDSAGTAEIGAQPPTDKAIQVARSMGVDLTGHLSKSLANVDPTRFDAIVGFERAHIAAAVVDGGAPHDRAFLLPELVRLLGTGLVLEGGDATERARSAIKGAARARGTAFVPGEEIDDPIGQPVPVYQRVYGEIYELTKVLATGLHGAREGDEPPRRVGGITW